MAISPRRAKSGSSSSVWRATPKISARLTIRAAKAPRSVNTYTLVCASAMSELAKGRNLDQALELEPQDVVAALGGLPQDHLHCARLAVNTLGEAIADYYGKIAR